MDNVIDIAKRWIAKLKITTDVLNDLTVDTVLPNGWTKRELLIHLSGWDDEFIQFADEMRKQKAFYAFYEEDGETKNQQFFEDNKDLGYEEVNIKFQKLRKKLIDVYQEIVEKYPQENKEFLGFFSIWWHDIHHLKQAGIDVSKLEE